MFDSYGESDSLGVDHEGGTGGGRGEGRPAFHRERQEYHSGPIGDRDTTEAFDLQTGERALQIRAHRDQMALGTWSVAGRNKDQCISAVQSACPPVITHVPKRAFVCCTQIFI